MNVRNSSHETLKEADSRIKELTTALHTAERKLAERDALVTAAIDQTEAARAQYAQANERAEALRRRLDARETPSNPLESQLGTSNAELKASLEALKECEQKIASLEKDLRQRDDRIAALEKACAEDDNALNAINDDVKRVDSANPNERFAAMGLVMRSLDQPGLHYKIGRATTTIGRVRANDIAINSDSVSRYHARIVTGLEGAYIIDLQSTNGCRVNGRAITRQVLSDGDIISIGDAKFRFSIGETLPEVEELAMDETRALLDDDVVFVRAAPKPKPHSAQ